MRCGVIPLLVLAMVLPVVECTAADHPLTQVQQCLVVLTDGWNAKAGTLRAFERDGSSLSWKPRGGSVPVVVGKKGLAWGDGILDASGGGGPNKIEGDNRAPAGFFRLGTAFGYAPASSAKWIRLPYLQLTKQIEGVDDPRSRYYNQLVDRSRVLRVDWHSSERMLQSSHLYKWGIFVRHNRAARPGAGSCIFLHIWKDPATATSGCTAMLEQDLVGLLRWLDPRKHPILLQMPRSSYDAVRAQWNLPAP